MVLHKADRTDARDVEDALTWALDHLARRAKDNLRPLYSERAEWRPTDHEAFRVGLERAGPQALRDFYGEKDGSGS